MKTICIVNLKGGVGKTVTAVNLAGILAEDHGKHVLLIDADPQANTTRFFGFTGDCYTIADIMRGDATGDIEDYVYRTGLDRVCLVPSEIALIEADIHSVKGNSSGDASRLHNFLSSVEEDGVSLFDDGVVNFDYCIIDCPPSFTAASV
ncbi:MAG: AAA family ATPase, partial [Oscillospiraceae bacterium]